MRKDSPLAFRIQTDLKKKLLKLAKQEARSLSQICEMLLKIGVEEYDKEGHKYLQKILISPREVDQGKVANRFAEIQGNYEGAYRPVGFAGLRSERVGELRALNQRQEDLERRIATGTKKEKVTISASPTTHNQNEISFGSLHFSGH